MKPRQCKNFSLVIATGNKRLPILVDVIAKDRRWFIFESGIENTKISSANWCKMHSKFRTQYFQKCLYQFLMSLDVEGFDFKQSKRSNTQSRAYMSVATSFIQPELLFLRDLIFRFKYYDFIANKEAPEWADGSKSNHKCWITESDDEEEAAFCWRGGLRAVWNPLLLRRS